MADVEKTIIIAYQVEIESNSLFQKLAKSFSEKLNVIAFGVSRHANKKNELQYRKIRFKDKEISYFEVSTNLRSGQGIKNLFGTVGYQFLLFRKLCELRKDIDFVYAIDFLMALPMFFFSLLFHKRFIYHVADPILAYNIPNILTLLAKMIDRAMFKHAYKIVVPHENRFEYIPASCREKTLVVYNSPEDLITQCDKSDQQIKHSKKLKLAFFGVLSDGRFINEILEIVSKNDDWLELHIGGNGPLENRVREYSEKYENIFFYGKVSYDKVLCIEKQCDLFFAMYDPSIPNHRVSSPNKVFEAMMLGKPIIVAKGMGIDNLVEQEKIGLTCEYSKEAFESLLKSLDENKMIMFGKNGRRLYEVRYSWTKAIEALLDAIEP
ncbi:glycosyltransferase [Pseudothermotoga lettingae]|uniref:Glycosyl transferase group 1 n=1 Tax=Pseudothermotoga lettingae (strain ATCC BAA-301 / DSM 14385 / NBRC 107922 / TMO) TaxID=416591 RepID=A8F6F6_PSELT|nr:glycosyltransferase [Pseudothermotoga lettingae]ABV33740.1 glycosyl transferase group 1 [Pseudothermotoga lettingae TMO]GLI49342.1 glycosyltransferase WbuB [Pseudothermotoga lettingae TMO]